MLQELETSGTFLPFGTKSLAIFQENLATPCPTADDRHLPL